MHTRETGITRLINDYSLLYSALNMVQLCKQQSWTEDDEPDVISQHHAIAEAISSPHTKFSSLLYPLCSLKNQSYFLARHPVCRNVEQQQQGGNSDGLVPRGKFRCHRSQPSLTIQPLQLGLAMAGLIAGRDEPITLLATSRGGVDLHLKPVNAKTSVTYPELDITDQSSVDRLKSLVEEKYGHIDVIINNAGVNIEELDNSTFGTEIVHKTFEPSEASHRSLGLTDLVHRLLWHR